MVDYKIEPVSENSVFYNLYLYKEVKKRNGDIGIDIEDRIYGLRLPYAINILAHKKTQDDFEESDISLKEYLTAFYKNWNIFKNENY